jgi:hypothetical protein
MPNDIKQDVVKKHPVNVFLTTSTTALETFASAIKDETWHKLVSVSIPLAVGLVSFLIRRYIKHLECKRGIKTYTSIIEGLQEELNEAGTTKGRKLQLSREITKYKNDIIKLQESNIKIFID